MTTQAAKWMSIRDIAELLGASVSAIERMKALGQLPQHVELSKRMHRWRKSDVDAWLSEKTRESQQRGGV